MGFDCTICGDREIWAFESLIPKICVDCYNLNKLKMTESTTPIRPANIEELTKKRLADEARKKNLEKARAAKKALKKAIEEKETEVSENEVNVSKINKMFSPLKESDLPKEKQVQVTQPTQVANPIITQPINQNQQIKKIEEESDDDTDEDESSCSGIFFKLGFTVVATLASVLLPSVITTIGDIIVSRQNAVRNDSSIPTIKDNTQAVNDDKNSENISPPTNDFNSPMYNGVSIFKK